MDRLLLLLALSSMNSVSLAMWNPRFASDEFDTKLAALRAARLQAQPAVRAPTTRVLRGHGGRVELVEATIRARNLDTGATTNQASRDYVRRLGRNDDDAGHIVANRLGGGVQEWNLFPQDRNINRGVWSGQEAVVYNLVQRGATVEYTIILEYATPQATRPENVLFRWRNLQNGQVFTGDVVNRSQ